MAEYTAGADGVDVVLRDKSGLTEVPLKLFQQSGEIPGGYRSEFDPLRAEQVNDSQASHATQPPEAGLVSQQRSFHNGAGQVYHHDAIGGDTGPDLERYAHSDGVLGMFPGKAVLGYQEDWADTVLQNGRGTQVGAYADTAVLLAEALDATETAIDVDDGDYFVAGDIIQVGAEKMKVVSISTNTLTVVRGVAGTIAIAHDNNVAVRMQGATGWDDNSNITDVFVSADSKTGDYGIKFSTDTGAGYLGQRYKGTASVLEVPIAGAYTNVTVTFGVYAKRISGSGTLTPRIVDSGIVNSGSAITSSAFTYGSASGNLTNGFTTLDFRLITSAAGDVWVVDDMFVIITGCNGEWTKMVRFKGSNTNHEFYAASGGAIFKWDETDDVFYPVHLSDSDSITGGTPDPFTDLAVFDDGGTASFLLAGRGDDATSHANHYMRSADGVTFSDPTTPTGNASKAKYFLRMRNANGDAALMKTRANKVSISTDASSTANWGAEIKAGDVDAPITSLFSVNDAGYVGKEDGLWVYNPVDDLFEELEPDANFFAHPNNYSRAIGRGGSIWARGGDHSLFKIAPIDDSNNFAWDDVSDLVSFPEWSGFGAGVRALAQDRRSVWAALDGADKQVTKSYSALAQDGASRDSSSEGNNNPWRATDGGTLSNAISERDSVVFAAWDLDSGLRFLPIADGDNSDHIQAQWGSNNPAIPSNSTITGVRVVIYQGNLFGNARFWNDVSLLGPSNTSPSTDRIGEAKSSTVAETNNGSVTFGGSTDTWGATLTPAICSDPDFGIEGQLEGILGFMLHTVDAVLIQVYYTEAGSDRSRIVTLSQDKGRFIPQTISNVPLENPDRIERMYDAANTKSSAFILGRTNNSDANADELRAIRMRIPVGDQDPSALLAPEHRRSGSIYTPWMDNFFPDVPKGALKLTAILRNCTPGERIVKASYKLDNATNDDQADWNPWGGTEGTTNIFDSTSGSETQAADINSPTSYNRIRLCFQLETDDPANSPELLGFVLTSSWVPDRVNSKKWVLICDMSSGTRTEMNTESADQIIANLETLAGKPFITMEEYRGDGDDSVTTHTVQLVNIRDEFERQEVGGRTQGAAQHHILRLQLVRQNTA